MQGVEGDLDGRSRQDARATFVALGGILAFLAGALITLIVILSTAIAVFWQLKI
jgi:hypothetical protein